MTETAKARCREVDTKGFQDFLSSRLPSRSSRLRGLFNDFRLRIAQTRSFISLRQSASHCEVEMRRSGETVNFGGSGESAPAVGSVFQMHSFWAPLCATVRHGALRSA